MLKAPTGNGTRTRPIPPNVGSGSPAGVSRIAVMSVSRTPAGSGPPDDPGTFADPPTTIDPSGWRAAAPPPTNWLAPNPATIRPPTPNDGSSWPVAVSP